jgi:hypothetical protein
MERIPIELLFVLAFIGIVLFNYLMQRAPRRRQQDEQPQAEAAAKAAAALNEEQPLEEMWGRSPAPAAAPVLVARAAPLAQAEPLAPRRRHPLRALLRDKRNLHRAIVLMTVLGPCRAQEPPERYRHR